MHAVGCAHDSGEKRNVLIVSICLFIGVGFTLRSNTHRAVKDARGTRSDMVGFNKNAFKPQIAAIKDKYYEMFRNKTKS